MKNKGMMVLRYTKNGNEKIEAKETRQWKDNGNIEDDKLIVVGIPEDLIMGTFMDDLIFFYCEDEEEWESLTTNKGGDFVVVGDVIDIPMSTKLRLVDHTKCRPGYKLPLKQLLL